MPEEFENSPLDEERRGSHADWSEVIKYSGRGNFDTPTSPLHGAEFWQESGGGKSRRDIEKIEVAREFASLGLDQLHAPCNLRSLQIDEAEAFIQVGSLMLRAWRDASKSDGAGESSDVDTDEFEGTEDEDEDPSEDEMLLDAEDDDVFDTELPGIVYRKKFESVLSS